MNYLIAPTIIKFTTNIWKTNNINLFKVREIIICNQNILRLHFSWEIDYIRTKKFLRHIPLTSDYENYFISEQ